MSTIAPIPIPATEEPVFTRHSRQSSIDSHSDVLEASSAESDNDDSDGQIEELYREEEDPLRDNKFRSLTGASPRVSNSRSSRDRKHSVEEIINQSNHSNHLAPPNSHQQQPQASTSENDNEIDHIGPSGHGFPNQEEYDRALLHDGVSDEEYDELPNDDDGHLDFEDHRGVDLHLDVDTEDESCSDDGSSESDEDDWGRILQRPCDVRKVAPLGVDVTSPKFDGRTSQEFLEAMSPRFENTVPNSPRPNIRNKTDFSAIKPRRSRGVTFNDQTMTLLSTGETQLNPLIDDEEEHDVPHSPNYNDPQHWNGQEYDDDLALQYSSSGHQQSPFPTIQVSDVDSPRSDDDAKRHEELQKFVNMPSQPSDFTISIPVCMEAISTLEKKLRLSADKLADTRAQLDEAKQQLEEKHDGYCEQEGRIADLQEELEGLREKMADVEKSASDANKAREAAVAELESQKQMMKLQDSTLERLKSTMSLKTEKLEQIEDVHKTELKRVKESLQGECDDLRKRNTNLTKDNKELRAQLSNLLSNTRALRDSYSRVRTSLHTQAEAQKILNGATRSTKPRSEWDRAGAGRSPASQRKNGATPIQQRDKTLTLWTVIIPTAVLAMGLLAKTMSGRS